MKNTFKKVLASAVMVTILGSLALNVNAAALTSTASYTGTTLTVTAPIVYATDDVTTIRLTDSAGAVVGSLAAVGTIVEGTTSFDIDAGTLADDTYAISFVTADGDFGSAVFTVGSADQIQVTANVLPILSMKVSGGAVAFGDLVADTATTAATTTTIAVNTNAADGYTMQVANTGLESASGAVIPAATTDENLASSYGYGINAIIDNGATIDSKVSATGVVNENFDGAGQIVTGMSSTPAILSSATGPVSAQTTTVSYHTRISALQETGNYSDTITYSITGAF